MKHKIFTLILVTLAYHTFGQVTNGLISKYSFNNGNANDDVGNNDGNVFGATLTSDRFGNVNAAYLFVEDNQQYIEVPYSPDFTPGTEPFSLSAWFLTASTDTIGGSIVDWYRCGANANCNNIDAAMYTIMLLDSDEVYYDVRDDNGFEQDFYTPSPVNDGNWHHAVLVWDPTADYQMYCYLDNVPIDSAYTGGISLNDGGFQIPFSIGRHFITGWGVPEFYFDGKIDDIRFYDRPLSAIDVDSLFHEPDWNTTGISSPAVNDAVNVYPSPVTSVLTITFPDAVSIQSISVFSIDGREEFPLHPVILNPWSVEAEVSSLSPGLYFIKAITEDGVQTGRFLKQ